MSGSKKIKDPAESLKVAHRVSALAKLNTYLKQIITFYTRSASADVAVTIQSPLNS
jgi:hypothetical protein